MDREPTVAEMERLTCLPMAVVGIILTVLAAVPLTTATIFTLALWKTIANTNDP